MGKNNLPNVISLVRIVLVPPFIMALTDGRYFTALLLFGVAGLSDALDGYLAKRYGWKSRLGSILDPLADKILLVSAYIALAWLGLLPAWLVAVVLGRDVMIVGGALVYHYTVHPFDLAPTRISKVNTVLQITLVLAVMLKLSLLPLPEWSISGLIYLALIFTVWSWLDYVWTWSARASQVNTQERRD
jgi:cardiolipin synthase